MTLSTIERAYQLARAGKAANLPGLKRLLKESGCRAVDTLLAPRNIASHLEAICAAAYKPQAAEPQREDA